MEPSRRRLSVLLLCDDTPGHAGNLIEHIRALLQLSRHRVRKFNPVGTNRVRLLDLEQFDVVVIHYSLFIGSEGYLPESLREAIRAFEGLKVQFIQDEYRWVDEVTAVTRDLGIDVLYTLVPADAVSEIYGSRLPGVHIVPTLAGFVPHDLAARRVPSLSERLVDIGYRGRSVPFWLGRLGQEKVLIGQGVLDRAETLGVVTDIAWRESDRIYGEDWYRFLMRCKVTLGTESGSSIVDYDGSLQRRVDAYLAAHPGAEFEEIHGAILAPYEGNTIINVVSPRVFEAAALRTGLVLFPGDHSGVVRPWEHYIPLEKDFSNFDEVVSALRDPELLQRLMDAAFEELVASGDYSLQRFVREFDGLLDERGAPVGRRRGIDVRLARMEASTRKSLSVRAAADAMKLVDVLRSRSLRRLLFGYLSRRSSADGVSTRAVLADLRKLMVLRKARRGELSGQSPVGIDISFDRSDGRLTIRTVAVDAQSTSVGDSGLAAAREAILRRDVNSIVWDSSEARPAVAARRNYWLGFQPPEGEQRLGALEAVAKALPKAAAAALVDVVGAQERSTSVDAYWGDHTVNSRPFKSAKESREYLEWRFDQYPRYRELMGLWGDHTDEIVLDYGCGPGDDTVGLLLYSGAKRVVGVDISARALELARRRIALHAIDEHRVHLIRISDAEPVIPLEDSSINVVHCSGVLHHTSDPESILREFNRVLKPQGRAQVMVYNRDSVWFHLYTAYVRMIREGAFAGLSVEDAFARNTDGPDCPISRCYRPAEFLALAQVAGLKGAFVGGYLSRTELAALAEHREAAEAHAGLRSEHREFIHELMEDESGLPTYRGFLAGIGGTFHLKKP